MSNPQGPVFFKLSSALNTEHYYPILFLFT
jgi:hypothetical protein